MSELDDLLNENDKPEYDVIEGEDAVIFHQLRTFKNPKSKRNCTAVDYYRGKKFLTCHIDDYYEERYGPQRKQWMAEIVSAIKGKRVQTVELADAENKKIVKQVLEGGGAGAEIFVVGTKSGTSNYMKPEVRARIK